MFNNVGWTMMNNNMGDTHRDSSASDGALDGRQCCGNALPEDDSAQDGDAAGSPIDAALDQFTCEAIGESLDVLAEHGTLWPRLYFCTLIDDAEEIQVECRTFSEDSADACLEAARAAASELPATVDMYAIVYDGFFQIGEDGESADALICIFAQRGMANAWSAYVPYGFGEPGSGDDGFWSDEPLAGGAEPNLLG